jgi:hypothetical protein
MARCPPAARRNGEIAQRIIEHPFRVVCVDDSRLSGQQDRRETNRVLETFDGGMDPCIRLMVRPLLQAGSLAHVTGAGLPEGVGLHSSATSAQQKPSSPFTVSQRPAEIMDRHSR